jgi:hypothetical protein
MAYAFWLGLYKPNWPISQTLKKYRIEPFSESLSSSRIQMRAGWALAPYEYDLFIILVLISYKSLLISSFTFFII